MTSNSPPSLRMRLAHKFKQFECFRIDIGMYLGILKCAGIKLRHGKLEARTDIEFPGGAKNMVSI